MSDSDKTVYIELDDSQSPKTVKAILKILPIEVKINTQSVVKPLDVAYWPEEGLPILGVKTESVSSTKIAIVTN
jgi:hypothetical protein